MSQPFDIRDVWRDRSGTFAAAAARAGAGFSFKYDGAIVGPEVSADWGQTVSGSLQSGVTETQAIHASGLVVTREARSFSDLGAVEYKLRFKNTSPNALNPVSEIYALDLSFEKSVLEGAYIVSSGGGLADGFFPPRTFAIRKHRLASAEGLLDLTTEGGRSSNKDLPFFFVHNDAAQAGLFVAFGWSGQWVARISRDPASGALRITGKIPDVNIALESDEEIQGPTILLGSYEGSLSDGCNRLRRLIRDAYTPKLAGEPFLPLATYTHFFNVGVEFDETLLKSLAGGAAAIEQDVFLLDAGWYAGTDTGGDSLSAGPFSAGLGNWYDVDQNKLPSGLKHIADDVREPRRESRRHPGFSYAAIALGSCAA